MNHSIVNEWRYWQHPVSGVRLPIFVQHVSSRGTVYYVKPNPWTGRDARQGWTKRKTARQEDLVLGAVPTEQEIRRIVNAIGEPPLRGWQPGGTDSKERVK